MKKADTLDLSVVDDPVGCYILCSDVPKGKNFICSHPDPLNYIAFGAIH